VAALRSYCMLDTGREARFDDLTALAISICEAPVSLVTLVDSDRLFFKSAQGLDVWEMPRGGFCDHAIRQRDLFVVPDAVEDQRFSEHPLVTGPLRVRFYAGVPLITPHDHAVGTLCIIDFVPRKLQTKQTEALQLIARQVMSQMELSLLTLRDPLTGLYNRRQIEETLHRELLRARRIKTFVAVMAIDVDYFKRVNDTLGHDAGDAVLRSVADQLSARVREEDVACRAGGEEFVIILPGTDEAVLYARAEAVRRAIEQAHISVGGDTLQLTVSIGMACFPVHGDTVVEILRAADTALYQAKAAGRNRIMMYALGGAHGSAPRLLGR